MRKKKSREERKEETVFKKADELSVLCGIEVCLISYGVNGEIKTFPEDKERVCDMARRFTQLSEGSRVKKSTSLDDVLKDIELQKMKKKVVEVDSNLGSHYDSYSIDELKLEVDSIRRKFRSIHEYRENNKEKKKIDYGNIASSSELGFESSKKKNLFDGFVEEPNEFPDPTFGFESFGFDSKEVESLLGNYDVEEETWNQGPFDQHHHNNNLRL